MTLLIRSNVKCIDYDVVCILPLAALSVHNITLRGCGVLHQIAIPRLNPIARAMNCTELHSAAYSTLAPAHAHGLLMRTESILAARILHSVRLFMCE